MFKSISYLRYDVENARDIYRLENARDIYRLVDSDFTCEVSSGGGSPSQGAIVEYSRRNLSVVKNIALLYCSTLITRRASISSWTTWDRDQVDLYHPDLEYGKKHYRCILNQIKILQFVKGIKGIR